MAREIKYYKGKSDLQRLSNEHSRDYEFKASELNIIDRSFF